MPDDMATGDTDARTAIAARSLVKLVATPVDDGGDAGLADRLVDNCLRLVGVDAAAVFLSGPEGALELAASSARVAPIMDSAERGGRPGCCPETWAPEGPIVLADPEARNGLDEPCRLALLSAGFSAVHPFALRREAHTMGALYLFLADRPSLSDADRILATALADAAAITLLNHRLLSRAVVLADQLQGALNSRISVERATGVLAQYAGIGMGAAFDTLRSYARSHRLKLSRVAEQVVARELDPGTVLSVRRRT